jgi:chondroitin AC lyase
MSIRAFAVAAVMAAVCQAGLADMAGDFNVIRQRLIDEEMAGAGSVSTSTVTSYMNSLGADGSWSDIDYDDTTGTVWLPRTHLTRLSAMSRLYNLPTNVYYHSAALLEKYLLALDYWYDREPWSSNSWWNEIGGPQMLKGSLLIMQDELSPAELSDSVEYLRRGDLYTSSYSGGGANMVDLADITIARGVLDSSPTTLQMCFDAVTDTLAIVTGDGVKADFSFHQHSRILYNGGYGLGFAQQSARLVALPEGTSFAFADEQKEVLVQYMLAGQQWMMRGSLDYSTQGRSMTRSGQQAPGSSLLDALHDVMSLDTPEQYELQRMIDRIDAGGNDPTNYLSGNRSFYRSDFMTHHRRDWYTSVHMVSTRTHGSESGNGEGLKNYYMGDGVNFITRGTFGEYSNIFPAWDWRRLPGLTAEQDAGSFPLIEWGSGTGGSSAFVGGVSDGNYGACTETYGRDHVSADKSWFFFDDEFVALGAGIQAPAADDPVYTSVNQSLASGTVTVKDAAGTRTVASGTSTTLSGAEWAHHDQTGYVFPGAPGNVTVARLTQSGSWYDINHTYSSSTVNKNVFSAWFDHGAHTSGGQYAYVVVPGLANTSAVDAYAAALPITVLRNDSSVQAVRHEPLKITQAVFRHAGPLTVAPGLTITPDHDVMVMLQERGFGMVVSLAQPDADPNSSSPTTVRLDVTFPLRGDGCTYDTAAGVSTLEFDLPTLQYAGATVTKAFDYRTGGAKAAEYEPTADTAVLYHMDGSPGEIVLCDGSGNALDLQGTASKLDDEMGPAGLKAAATFTAGAGAAATLPRRTLSQAEEALFDTDHFTIEAWVKNPDTSRATEGIFEMKAPISGRIQFGLTGRSLELRADGLIFAGPIQTGDLVWDTDAWYHVAVTVDGGDPGTGNDPATVRFYQTPESDTDGVANLVGTLTGLGGPFPMRLDACLVLGGWDNSDSEVYSGLMDEVRYENRALAADEFNLTEPEPTAYHLTVHGGAGGGDYYAGEVVGVAAGTAPEGMVFDCWAGDTADLADELARATTLTMPAADVEITATWRSPAGAILVVNGGTGGGAYVEGEVVDIQAAPASTGWVFAEWTGDVDAVADARSPLTTVTMPASGAEVTAGSMQTGAGLLARLPFDVDARDVVGANDGTLNSGAAIVSDPRRGKVLSLDGTNDHVRLPTGGMAAGRSELTLAMWVCPSRWEGTDTLYDEDSNGYWQFSIRTDGWYTRDIYTGETGGRNNDIGLPTVGVGEWHHLAFVYSVSEGLKAVYCDGEPSSFATNSVDRLTTSRSNVNIAAASDGTYYSGRMDELLLYGRALSDTEIAALARQAYALTVTGGSGSGVYACGAAVIVSADSPPAGQVFDTWAGDADCLADPASAATTVTMPDYGTSLTATYATAHALTVNHGSGGGMHKAGDVVAIAADAPPAGMRFNSWWGDVAYVADFMAAETTFTMPAADATVTAKYQSLYPLAGDRDGDGFVGQVDLDIVLGHWGKGAPGNPISDHRADANGDGFVGQADLDIVLGDWGKNEIPQ